MIVVFGSVNLDLIGRVERLPRRGETVPGLSFETAPGGKGANQALAAARAGAPVRMVGAVGSDAFAEEALSLLEPGGVDLSGLRRVEGGTGVALILVDRAGENVIAPVPGANGAVSTDFAEAIDLSAGDVLLLQLEVPVVSVEAAARRARQAGALVVVSYAPFRDDALAVLDHATHLVVNETECEAIAALTGLGGEGIEAAAVRIAAARGLIVVVTLGRDGVLAAGVGGVVRATALAVDAVDTVGAGDTFSGYFAAALSEGRELGDALGFAAAAASLACTRPGAQPSIPHREEVVGALVVSRR